MRRLIGFLTYNNAVPIALGIIILGGTGAFAATDPQAVLSSSEKVLSVDNTYIANKDLSTYSPRAEVLGVTEDADAYYVAYRYYSIDVKDYVWQDIVSDNTITVSKAQLGPNQDLGVYVTGQLKDLIWHTNEYLQRVQAQARQETTQKVVSTQYSGIVGKFLDDKSETLPGYTPVVTPESPATQDQTAAVAASNQQNPMTQTDAASPTASPQAPTSIPTTSGGIQVMGNNPAKIPLKSSYSDLGVFVSSPHFQPLGIHLQLDGKDVNEIQIDTSAVGTHAVVYTVNDDQGASITATRVVEVYDPYPVVVVTPPASSAATTTDATTTP